MSFYIRNRPDRCDQKRFAYDLLRLSNDIQIRIAAILTVATLG